MEMVIWGLTAVAAAGVAAGWWVSFRTWSRLRAAGWNRSAPPGPTEPGHTFSDEASVTVDGGGMAGRRQAPSPLVVARIDDEFVHLDIPFGGVWVPRAELKEVAVVPVPFGRTFVLFRSESHRWDGVAFKPSEFGAPEWYAALERFGWPVVDQRRSAPSSTVG